MSNFYTYTTNKRVATIQADSDKQARNILLASILKREIDVNPLMTGDRFFTLQQTIWNELASAKVSYLCL